MEQKKNPFENNGSHLDNYRRHRTDQYYTTQPIRDEKKLDAMIAELRRRNIENDTRWATWLELWVVMQLHTGLRLSEMRFLQWDKVMKAGVVRKNLIIVPLKQGQARQKKKRTIPILPALEDALYRHYKNQGPAQLIFESSVTGREMTKRNINQRISTLFQQFDIAQEEDEHASTHALRKTFALRYFIANGLVATMRVLGHSREEMTIRYLGITHNELKNGFKMIRYGEQSLISRIGSGEIAVDTIIDFALYSANFTIPRLRRDLRAHLERFSDSRDDINLAMEYIENQYLYRLEKSQGYKLTA